MHNCLIIEYYKSYISFDFKVMFYKILILIVYWGKIDLTYYKWLKLHSAYLKFFFLNEAQLLKHYKNVEMKQFSKVDIKQNNVSSVFC